MPQSPAAEATEPAARNRPKEADEAQADAERAEPSVSRPGGFANDPDDSTNPNEVIERSRQNLRP
jgi:hypothetical protein